LGKADLNAVDRLKISGDGQWGIDGHGVLE
jgi:hypothetical protein